MSVIDGMDIGLATRWATSIEAAELRDATVNHAFRRWLGEQPEAARAWFESAPLSEPWRASLQQSIEAPTRP